MKYLTTTLFLIFLGGCSIFYVTEVALEQISIWSSKKSIDKVLKDKLTDQETVAKLKFIKELKTFMPNLGFKGDNAFTSYVKLDRPELSWIVTASYKTSFNLITWWFPIVGRVPYRGFFLEEKAKAFAKDLEKDPSLETIVRPTDAYSTLGWFSDPIISTFLRRDFHNIANTIIHETFHSNYWFKNHVEFNETVANLVGIYGAVEFFEKAKFSNPDFNVQKIQWLEKSKKNLESAKVFSVFINKLFSELDAVYKDSTLDEAQKLIKRESIFAKFIKPVKEKNPDLKSFTALNNAEIMQAKIYYTNFEWLEEKLKSYPSLADFILATPKIFEEYKNLSNN